MKEVWVTIVRQHVGMLQMSGKDLLAKQTLEISD